MFTFGATPRSAPAVIVIIRENALQARQFECLADADAVWSTVFLFPGVLFLQRADGEFVAWKEYGLWSSVGRIKAEWSDPFTRRRLLPALAAVPAVAQQAAAGPFRAPAAAAVHVVVVPPPPPAAVVVVGPVQDATLPSATPCAAEAPSYV